MKSLIIVFITLFLAGSMNTAGAVSRTANIYQTIDKASLPTNLYIWASARSNSSNNDVLVCQSTTDATHGACPTTSIYQGGKDFWRVKTPVALTFTNAETGSTQTLMVTGVRCAYFDTCYEGGAGAETFSTAINNGFNIIGKSAYTAFSFWLSKSVLTNLTPGVWRATLLLSLKSRSESSESELGQTWTANLVLTVKDITAPQIYFPTFPSSTPSVNLNLSNLPGTDNNTTASGSNTLDMCLYDGRDSASSSMTLLFKDSVGNGDTTGRSSGLFSLFQYNVTAPSGRLDYQVSFVNPVTGSTQVVANGTPITLDTSQSGVKKRRVTLPGFSDISICIPAPLTLDTPSFVLSSKYQGNYFGTLIVIYTPSTS